ncbi:hypothetical protein MAA5396_05106 [Marinovum algicola]|uniref:Uncharacterized protein n=1 Tax=Marinovum algicola TaxID=42444 RepID=A0A975WFQ9_9RHOB|nr:hypothetical protein [Marinovum algicola]SEK12275.1 hypothetical protein SAMN04487940_1503 [Marinovum algicola]SLN77788.1 hypothetical protein MAA5396_05106 [Marinovum algicola]
MFIMDLLFRSAEEYRRTDRECLDGNWRCRGEGSPVAQRQLAIWTLQPIAALLAEEATAKLGAVVEIDTIRPLQAFDAGGRARALSAIIKTLAEAKEAGIPAGDVSGAMRMVDWGK